MCLTRKKRTLRPMADHLTDDQLMAMVLPVLDAVPIGSRWRHRKGGDPYQVEAVGLSEGGQQPVVGYRAERPGAVLWLRVACDFLDGRFERIHKGEPSTDG